jgi:serine/threonine protein kinase
MTPERHEQICDLLYRALELDADQRDSFLDRACSADSSLRREIDSLLFSGEDVRANFLRSSTLRLALQPGTKLGEYEVESLLGSGGMGEVYRARDPRLARDVAIKVLPSYLSSDRKQLRRFETEARAAAALNHPNILAVFQMGEHQGVPYLISELLEGETIRDKIQHGPLPLDQTISFALQVGKGLTAAHERGIVHRDLKPENLFVTTDGHVKILDFGLAKISPANLKEELATEAGVVMGTPGYMSPEQARGQPADSRSDIFAFGVVLYEMLTGRRAFERGTAADCMSAILNDEPPSISKISPNYPPAVQRLVQRCLRKKPEERFQCASDVVRELESLPASRDAPILKVFALALALAIAILVVVMIIQKKDSLAWVHGIFNGAMPGQTKPALLERKLTANLQGNPVTAVAISRDGRYIAYTDKSKNVHLLLADSGDVRSLSLSSSYEPVDWFPDGVHLLLKQRNGQPGLWRFSTWDSSLQKLWEGPMGGTGSGPVRNAAVSPDGSSIAFLKGENLRELWLMGALGEEPHKILEFTEDNFLNIVWSPNGKRLAYIRARGRFAKHESVIETCDLKGNDRVVVLSEPNLLGRDGFAAIAWLAGGRIVYSPSTNLDEYNLWTIMVSPDSGAPIGYPKPLTDWKDLAAPGFESTADGKRIVALKAHSEDAIYVGALASESQAFNVKPLMADSWRNAAKSWTKDSKDILLFSKRNGRWAICIQDISTGNSETLIMGPENYRDPVASITGRLLYNASASDTTGDRRLMSTPMDGGSRSVLVTGPHSFTFDCPSVALAPCVLADQMDNQLIFFSLDPDPARGKGSEIARVPYHTGDLPHWSLSPDGTKIALVGLGGNGGEVRILSPRDRRISPLPLKGWKWKYFTGICWAANGKQFFATAASESSSALISIDPAGRLAILHEVDPGQAWIQMPIASPDGRFLAFTKRTYVSDAVMLENF